ncbi:GNAT family N-acetyltransferase [Corallincola platygyrae]|uniref:GNAT family N-acetyltransferase n=1 Tax=Corallincola platygyrae TaxID=1193278 RepID=A0ABW4XRP9_9GAMM
MAEPEREIQYLPIEQDDIDHLTSLMAIAFDADAQKFLGQLNAGPEGYNDGRFLRKWALEDSHSLAFKICLHSKPVGAFIVWWEPEGESRLGNIFLAPTHQNQGIGSVAWRFIEQSFPTRRWRLGTPVWNTKNHFFYEKKCGFRRLYTSGSCVVFEKNYV